MYGYLSSRSAPGHSQRAGFPSLYGSVRRCPPLYQGLYEAVRLDADLLSAQQLADQSVFNAEKYAAYVHVYGNTFPLEAFDNLVVFQMAEAAVTRRTFQMMLARIRLSLAPA